MKINDYMNLAINEAKNTKEDIPICAIIEKDGKIISIKTNEREKNNQTIAHAEILAIDEANLKLNSWRLDNCNMYVTLEPCPMCSWAIINSRIKNLYFGSYDLKYGALLSALDLRKYTNSKLNVFGGIEEKRCNRLLDEYFEKLRNEKNT